MHTLSFLMTAAAIAVSVIPASAELGTNVPPNDDTTLLMQREMEVGCDTSTTPPTCPPASANLFDSGIFDVPVPGSDQPYSPAGRVQRDKFGVVGPFMLKNGLQEQLPDLDPLGALVYPGTSDADKEKLAEGMTFFTMFHTPGEGLGPLNNQPACIGCHLNAADAVKSRGLLQGQGCQTPDFVCTNVSLVTRAARSTLTNFNPDTGGTALDPTSGGGRAPNENVVDLIETVFGPGRTAAFTTFGNFSPTLTDNGGGPANTTLDHSVGCFDPLDGSLTPSGVVGSPHTCVLDDTTVPLPVQAFGGFVQHVRPGGFVLDQLPPPFCDRKPLPPLSFDMELPNGNSGNPNNFRRSVGERAGPPYIGRGLMEAVPTNDILYFAANASDFGATAPSPDPQRANGKPSSVTTLLGCSSTGCISGNANMIPRTFARNTSGPNAGTDTGSVGGVGRFGLRANGVEILQFAVGGLQGELSFTSLFNPREINFPTLFPGGTTTAPEPEDTCLPAVSQPLDPTQPIDLNKLEVHLSEPFSERNFIRNTAPPEFGDALIDVLEDALSHNSEKVQQGNRKAPMVKRGAELFGIDLVAFANRTMGGPMQAGGDRRDDNAINQADRKLNCVGCHIPIRRTGQSPAALTSSGVGSANLSYKWAPIFSDQLLHHMPVISGERETTNGLPRDVVVITRASLPRSAQRSDDDDPGQSKGGKVIFDTLDLPRNLADDTFSNAKATAEGSQFRTAPLMGLGRIGTPMLHDGRVYLSRDTVDTTPAGTVTTNSRVTNAPLVVRSLDDALLAAIELHDLPAPGGDASTPIGGGCPVPQTNNVTETAAEVCPPYDTLTSQTNRSDAREVIYRFRRLPPEDQQAVIEFLKQL
jgi:hypothetical protein